MQKDNPMLVNTFPELKEVIRKVMTEAQMYKYPLSVVIKEHKPKRSSNQNNLYQSITRRMAIYTGYSHGEMKLELQRQHLGTESFQFMFKGMTVNRQRVITPTDFESDQFSNFLEVVIGIAADMGIMVEGDE